MFKNVSGQKFRVFAFDSATGLPKPGDAANITGSISKDFGAVTDLAATSATEEDSTKAKGYYLFDAAQAETNADDIAVSARSSTTGIVVIGAPARITTLPVHFGEMAIDASGRLLANADQLAGQTVNAAAPVTFPANVASTTNITLAASGLDAVSMVMPTGVASNFREAILQLWNRFFGKVVYDTASGTLKNYASGGSTVITTQTLSDISGVQTQGQAS